MPSITPRRSALRVVVALATVVGGLLLCVGPVSARPGDLDASFGQAGRTTLDWSETGPCSMVGAAGPYIGAAAHGRFAVGGYNEFGVPSGPVGMASIGLPQAASARGIADGGPAGGALVFGNTPADFALAHFTNAEGADPLFGARGAETVHFGAPAIPWAAVPTFDTYGWVVAGQVQPPGSNPEVAMARIDEYGNLVGSFGTGGKLTLDLGPGGSDARAVLRDDAGNLVVAGHSGNAVMVARVTPTGGLDPTFGKGGVVRLTLGSGPAEAQAITRDPYGLLVAGQAGTRGFVLRLTPDGTLDRTFGHKGTVVVSFGGKASGIRTLLAQNGKLIVAGQVVGARGVDVAVARLADPRGSFDASFGKKGIATANFGGPADQINGLILPYQDGTIRVTGGDGQHAIVWDLTARGTPDTRLGPKGQKAVACAGSNSGRGVALATTAEGGAVIAGDLNPGLGLVRLTPSGAVDSSFGNGGYVDAGIGVATASAVAVAPDGRIVVWGATTTGFLARFRPDGSWDPTFGRNGIVTVAGVPGLQDSLLIQPDGDIVAIGFGFLGRWLPDGSLDAGFAHGGTVRTPGDNAPPVIRQPDGKLVIYDGTLVRYNSDGTEDLTFHGQGGGNLAWSSTANNALALAPDGGFIVAGMARAGGSSMPSSEELVDRFGPDGQPDPTFATNGTYSLGSRNMSNVPQGLSILPDGRILVADLVLPSNPQAGAGGSQLTMLSAGGQPDPTFGQSGTVPEGGALALPGPSWVLVLGFHGTGDSGRANVSALTTVQG